MSFTPGVPDHEINRLIQEKNYALAESVARARVAQNPADADAHYYLGVIQYLQGRIRPTIDHLNRAIGINPDHTDASVCLSVLYNDLGRYPEAKQVFEQANRSVSTRSLQEDLGTNRKFAIKHMELGDLYFRYRRYDEAIEEYSRAAKLDPQDLDIRIRRAKAHAKKGYLTRAFQELQQLKYENPRYLPARIQLGLLHYSQSNILDAELEWEQALLIHPQCKEARAYLEMARKSRISL